MVGSAPKASWGSTTNVKYVRQDIRCQDKCVLLLDFPKTLEEVPLDLI